MRFLNARTRWSLQIAMTEPKFGQPLLRSILPEQVQAIVDIGAHVGVWSLMARFNHPQASVLAVEPWHPAYEVLVENVAGLRIDTLRMALGDGGSLVLDVENAGPTRDMSNKFVAAAPGAIDSVLSCGLPGFLAIVQAKSKVPAEAVFWKVDVEGAETILREDEASLDLLRRSAGFLIDIHSNWPRHWLDWARPFTFTHDLQAHRSNRRTGTLMGIHRQSGACLYHDFGNSRFVIIESA